LATICKAAQIIGLNTSTIHRWLADGFIAGEQLTPGAPWQIRSPMSSGRGSWTKPHPAICRCSKPQSFLELKRDAAPGVDELTWDKYAAGLKPRIADLHERVQRGA
jgi:hypothetical protein